MVHCSLGGVLSRSGVHHNFSGGPALLSPPDRFDGWTQGDHLRVVALAFGIDFILNAEYFPHVCDGQPRPRMGVSYAIRTCNEVCKDKTAALTVQPSVPSLDLLRRGTPRESLVSARDNTFGGRLWLLMVY